MDAKRNLALAAIRASSATGNEQSEQLAATIISNGGTLIDAAASPNSITASVPNSMLPAIASNSAVSAIREAPVPIWHSSPIDGSEIWHVNGFTGAGSSSDGLGGPDFVAFDQGVRVNHQAFRSRAQTDPPNTGLGTGSSRIFSPAGRTNFGGSQHANAVAAIAGASDLTSYATGDPSPLPANWQSLKGLAYGLDKLYDPYQAKAALRWELGISYQGEPGVADLPEVENYSAGIYEDNVDSNPGWTGVDAEVSQYGITQTISAGNCGLNNSIYTGCTGALGESAHRVSTPGNNYNTITVGGVVKTDPYNTNSWTVWPNSSPGPTYGGRKKPDLVAPPTSPAGGPASNNDTGYSSPGTGTSFAAPQAAAGAILLASSGVYQPTAQKAILINTAIPIQGQTYWTPRSGWGALNLDGAFTARGYYQSGSVSEAGTNGVRFYKQFGVSTGDRTTLVWNRRLGNYNGSAAPPSTTLTNLDLVQVDSMSGANTATGGVDASDTVDTNPTVTADNPMPGNGTDGSDNVEQVRSTASGTQVYKVKAQSTIDGLTSEPFSIAGAHPVAALETPIPNVSLSPSQAIAGPNQNVTITAQVENPSNDLALSGASVTLGTLPAGVSLQSGDVTQSLGTLSANGTGNASWVVSGSTDGIKTLSATASGTTYSEPFEGSGSTGLTIDSTPPTVSHSQAAAWSATASPTFTWSATDSHTSIDHYDVELAHGDGPFAALLTNTPATSVAPAGVEGEQLRLRVRAADALGNVSDWTERAIGVDAEPPLVAIGNATESADGSLTVPVAASNVGSPVTSVYSFSRGSQMSGGIFSGSTNAGFPYPRQLGLSRTVLSVTSTDALGRTVSVARTFDVAGSQKPTSMTLKMTQRRGGWVSVSGKIAGKASGKVALTAKPIGGSRAKGTKKTFKAKSGRFAGRIKLLPGRHRVTAKFAGSVSFKPSSKTKYVRVRSAN